MPNWQRGPFDAAPPWKQAGADHRAGGTEGVEDVVKTNESLQEWEWTEKCLRNH